MCKQDVELTETVASDILSIGLCKLHNSLTIGESEDTPGALRSIPFHAVPWSNLPEFLAIFQDGHIGRIGQLSVIRSRAEVLLSFRLS